MKMKFFIDVATGEVFSFDERQIAEGMAEGKHEMSANEVDAHKSPKPLDRNYVEAARLLAYAHPVTGCDRYKAEADAEHLAGNENAAKAAEDKLLSRREQIKKENPWPKEDV